MEYAEYIHLGSAVLLWIAIAYYSVKQHLRYREYSRLTGRRVKFFNGYLTGSDAERFIKNMENPVKIPREEYERMKANFDSIMLKSKGIR